MTTAPLTFSIITVHHGSVDGEDPVIAATASLASQEGVKSEHLFQHTAGVASIWNKLYREASLSKYTQQYTLRLLEERSLADSDQELLLRGMKRATGAIIGFLNPQEEYLPGALASVQQAFQEHPEVDLFITAAKEKGKEEVIVIPLFLEYLWTADVRLIPSTLFFRSSLLKEGFTVNPEDGEMAFSEWLLRLFQAKKKISSLACSAVLLATTREQEKQASKWKCAAPAKMRLLGPWWKFRYNKASKEAVKRLVKKN